MDKTTLCCALTGLMYLLGAAGCSSNSKPNYPQPGASQGSEATPPEPANTAPANNTNNYNNTNMNEPMPESKSGGQQSGMQSMPSDAQNTAMSGSGQNGSANLDPGQSVKVIETIDNGEIEQAQVALGRAQHPAVKQFANRMVAQHSENKQQMEQLSQRENITPSDSQVSNQVQNQAMNILNQLKSAQPDAFDTMYMNAQVKQHRNALNIMDSELLPNANNAQLRAQLQNTRTMLQNHLNDAESVQQSLSGGNSNR